MATRAPNRDTLYEKLREVLGPDEASTLMELLPENRDQLATRSDIDRLGQILGQRIEGVEQNMERFETRLWDFHEALRAQTRIYITAMLGSMVGVAGIAFAAAALV